MRDARLGLSKPDVVRPGQPPAAGAGATTECAPSSDIQAGRRRRRDSRGSLSLGGGEGGGHCAVAVGDGERARRGGEAEQRAAAARVRRVGPTRHAWVPGFGGRGCGVQSGGGRGGRCGAWAEGGGFRRRGPVWGGGRGGVGCGKGRGGHGDGGWRRRGAEDGWAGAADAASGTCRHNFGSARLGSNRFRRLLTFLILTWSGYSLDQQGEISFLGHLPCTMFMASDRSCIKCSLHDTICASGGLGLPDHSNHMRKETINNGACVMTVQRPSRHLFQWTCENR